jgi:corrinoid protein of di/trimethylamine methyltransferase
MARSVLVAAGAFHAAVTEPKGRDMLTHKQRILMAARGEMPNVLPYVPRIDLWYNANSHFGTLPQKHKGRTQDEISRVEGWALHKVVPEFLKIRKPEDTIHRALGIYALKEMVFDFKFSPEIEIEVQREGDYTRVIYHTPLGEVSTRVIYSDEMKRSGASITWIDEHVLKRPEDYKVVGHLFEHLELTPSFEDFRKWKGYIGDDGVACTMVGLASSPMHHIQKEFLDATDFYFHYSDYGKEMRALAGSVKHFFDQALQIIADSPAEAVLWGANFDDMITYPAYFQKEITPWIRKASEVLGAKGKIVFCHCDGENLGLMDLIRDSGMHVAEAICPYPMTKVRIEEYYQRWGDRLTIFGGMPSNMLLAESATDEEFEAYLDHLFKVIAPGKRFILGVADTTPPNAVFERLIRIGERVEREARLPLEAGAARPLSEAHIAQAAGRVIRLRRIESAEYEIVREDVLRGRHKEIDAHVQQLLDKGFNAKDILDHGMLSTMEAIGAKFKTGEVFIPEVLLSARAMNEAVKALEPHLAKGKRKANGKIIIGTVRGDLHDIGKNMVVTMLRGVGFEVKDLGINMPAETFVRAVADERPDILGMSALLTTTMQEMAKVIEALKASGLRERTRVIVGGAPLNAKFARDIGADGYAADAGEAVDLVKGLISKGH